MIIFSKLFRRAYPSAILAILLFQVSAKVAQPQLPRPADNADANQPVSLIVWTEQRKYSLGDSVKVNAALENTGDKPVYVDRRMFWTGFGGGLKLEIRDEQGTALPARVLSDAIMPPPKEGDLSVLIPLNEGFLYGTSVKLLVSDFFPNAGKYSIRVIYKSWLRKELVAPQLRDLHALWADSPEISSKPAWIEVTH